MNKNLKVTFRTEYKVKEGRKWVNKTSTFDEVHESESSARLRAMALGWIIVKFERMGIRG